MHGFRASTDWQGSKRVVTRASIDGCCGRGRFGCGGWRAYGTREHTRGCIGGGCWRASRYRRRRKRVAGKFHDTATTLRQCLPAMHVLQGQSGSGLHLASVYNTAASTISPGNSSAATARPIKFSSVEAGFAAVIKFSFPPWPREYNESVFRPVLAKDSRCEKYLFTVIGVLIHGFFLRIAGIFRRHTHRFAFYDCNGNPGLRENRRTPDIRIRRHPRIRTCACTVCAVLCSGEPITPLGFSGSSGTQGKTV